jgi:restriction endonuclease S subunit
MEQNRIVENYNMKLHQAEKQEQQANDLEKGVETYLFEALGIEKNAKIKKTDKLILLSFSKISEWGVNKIFENKYSILKYKLQSFSENRNLAEEIIRGKSPKYSKSSTIIILNQKCNRWNEIDLNHAKTVDKNWFDKLDKNQFTKIGDILINSTGEGTVGRATTINDNRYCNLIFDNHILLLRVNENYILPDFFTLLFNSEYGQQQVTITKSAQSTKQTELGIGNLRRIKFPLPPLIAQNKIVTHTQTMKEQINKIRQNAQENKQNAIKEFEREIFK